MCSNLVLSSQWLNRLTRERIDLKKSTCTFWLFRVDMATTCGRTTYFNVVEKLWLAELGREFPNV